MTRPPDTDLPGFESPLELLRACHTKILEHCDLLERLVAATRDQGDPAELREAARRIVSYFSSSARLHHQDEEVDLFPRLVRQSLKLADLVHALKQEHRQLDALWETLQNGLRRITELGDIDSLATTAAEFCTLNREHVRRENLEFLPLAQSSLSTQQLQDIGIAMAARRGVRYPGADQ